MKTLEEVLRDFVSCVDVSGGVKTDRKGYTVPVADEEWVDLGQCYLDAVATLAHQQSFWNTDLEAAPECQQVLVTELLDDGRRYVTVAWRLVRPKRVKKLTDDGGEESIFTNPEDEEQEQLPGKILAWKPLPEGYRPV